MSERRELIVCRCSDISHQMVACFDEDETNGNQVWVYYHLESESFLDRLKTAVKHLFGFKSKYGDFGEFIIDESNIDKFEEIVKFVKNK